MVRRFFVSVMLCAGILGVATQAHAASWVGSSPPVTATFYGVVAWDTLTAVAVGESEGGVVYRTVDGGKTWNSQISQSSPGIFAITRIPGTNKAMAVGRQALVWETLNQGATWTQIVPFGINPFADLYGVAYPVSQTGWVVGSSGVIYRTDDYSATWTQQPSGVTSRLNAVDFVDVNTGWAVGDSGVILRTTNGGNTWTLLPAGGASTNYYGVDFIDTQTGWVVGANGTILYTTNAGATWTTKAPETMNPGTTLRTVSFANSQDGIFAGSGGSVFTTANGGSTINQESLGASPYLYAAVHMGGTDRWVAGQSIVRHYDGVNPIVGQVSPTTAVGGTPQIFSVSVSDQLNAIVACTLVFDGLQVSMTINGNIATASRTFDTRSYDGGYSVYAQCTDAAGNVGRSQSQIITVPASISPNQPNQTSDRTPPQVGQINPRTATVNAPQTMSASVFDSQSAISGCQWFLNGGNMGSMNVTGNSLASVNYTFTSAGTYSVYAQCMDIWGNSASGSVVSMTVYTPSSPSSGGTSSNTSNPFMSLPLGVSVGDLVRGTVKSPYGGYPVYYVTSNGKKALFPNEATYKTWYSDFSAVKIIPQWDLESIPGADKNVTVRPGYSVVQFESDSGLYVVEPGAVIRSVTTDAAQAIFGASFRTLFVQNAFRANYRSGSPVSTMNRYDQPTAWNASPTIAAEMAR